jgi:hypothetical protein
MGRFSPYLEKNGGCSAFFREIIEVTRQYRAKNARVEERAIWQP